jgi:hypothetical protein
MGNEVRESRLAAIIDKISEHRSNPRLSHEEFVKRAIIKLRDLSKSRGIHSVISGFNQAFRIYYGEDNPVEIANELAQNGKIEIRIVRYGAMLYLPGEAPPQRVYKGEQALKKILKD